MNAPFGIIINLFKRYFSHSVSKNSAEFAYYFLFSFFPLLISLHAVIGIFHIDIQQSISAISIFPNDVKEMAIAYLNYIGDYQNTSMLVLGIVLSIYSATMAIHSIISSINYAFAYEVRHGIRNIIVSVFFTVLIAVQIFLSLMVIVVGRNLMQAVYFYFPDLLQYAFWFNLTRYLVVALSGLFALTLLYTIAPSSHIKIRDALPGAAAAEIAWIVVSFIFSFYASNMAQYSFVYGSIGAIIVLMLWFFISGTILLLGGELNAELFYKKRDLHPQS